MKPCRPKRVLDAEQIRRECEMKGVPVEDHPGPRWYLCECGLFHPASDLQAAER